MQAGKRCVMYEIIAEVTNPSDIEVADSRVLLAECKHLVRTGAKRSVSVRERCGTYIPGSLPAAVADVPKQGALTKSDETRD